MSAVTTGSQITIRAEEMIALQAFAAAHGRRWKSELSQTYWYNARLWRDHNDDTTHGSALHGLRNRLGPTWLAGFRFPKT